MDLGRADREAGAAVQSVRVIAPGTFCYVTRCWRKAWVGHVVEAIRYAEDVMGVGPDGTVRKATGWLVSAPWMSASACWICPTDHLFPIHQPIELEEEE